ncbi:hypothetical protein [Saccharothrix xinjiangensis]|uniref:Substrate-binding family protein n=1 Tax=Saccharothrix xinjiangensis TaxID=204798 RepID=A0ABV9YAJ8_9PSEU
MAALDAVEEGCLRRGKTVGITGLDERSATLHRTLSGELSGSR